MEQLPLKLNAISLQTDDVTETNKLVAAKSEINMSGKIKRFFHYKTFLTPDYSDKTICYHTFIIFLTSDGIYSIEKNEDGIIVNQLNNFSERILARDHPTLLITDRAVQNVTMADIMTYIEEKEFSIPYSSLPLSYNCQAFSERIIDFIMKKMKSEN